MGLDMSEMLLIWFGNAFDIHGDMLTFRNPCGYALYNSSEQLE